MRDEAQYQILTRQLQQTEQRCKANGQAYALIAYISSDEFSQLKKSLRSLYRYEKTRYGYRQSHYIRTNDRYSKKTIAIYGLTDAEAQSDKRNPLVAIRGIRRIEAKVQQATLEIAEEQTAFAIGCPVPACPEGVDYLSHLVDCNCD